ncbi:META domain-containing protein [Variovorax saccharolyticus]|uniref:META domain-containing protein n=1 Tax=Variovorax saccharolyticus TaxID=3053516 RepID=UPI0025771193|nr:MULTISPECIES: META domain-containing protein [unclassified Variovorax]MDM0019868.1 META domain-containing protein [Variovorax sp. J22R187]MDM0027565.1 META domain-containing protein [Variovorax sp. J31P216]
MRSRPAAIPFFTAALLAAALTAGCGSGIPLDEPIEGPVWRLDQLGGEPVTPGSDPRRDPQVQFDRRNGRVSGSGGCNQLSGTFERSGSTLKLSQLASTRMACTDPALGTKEQQFFAALQATASYRLQSPTRLALLDAGGRTVATLSASR